MEDRDSSVLIRRHGLPFRLLMWLFAVFFVGMPIRALFEPWRPEWVKPLFVVLCGCSAVLVVLIARREMVVGPDHLTVRNLTSLTVPWSSVVAIEPTRNGLAFELADGRRVVATVTAKSGPVFLPVRYDRELLAALRSRLDGGGPQPA